MNVEILSSVKYQPAVKRKTGQPLKSLLDCCIESEMGHKALALESVKLMIIRTSSTFRILASLNRARNSKDKVVPVHAVKVQFHSFSTSLWR
jgi:hypothetical protein